MRQARICPGLHRDEGGMTTLGFLLRLLALCALLGAVYAAVTLLPQILEIADGDPLSWEGHF